MSAPLVVARAGAVPPWARRIVGHVDAPRESLDAERLGGAPSVWIDGSLDHALDVARSVHRADPAVQVGVVAAREDRPVIERRLIFTPGVGEVWVVSPEDVDGALMRRAAEVTRTRRSYQAVRPRLIRSTQGLTGRPSRAQVSDAYLAALLEVLPDPVLSVDEDGAVVTWSAAAERMLARPAREAVGRRLTDLVVTDPPNALAELLQEARSGKARRELHFATAEPLVVEAVAIPVTAAGIQVRAVVLRDLTQERQTQERLREQAAALEEEKDAAARLAEERDAALQRLQAAMTVRSRFFASMSHEIRTPINAILGYNDLLLSGALGEVDPAHLAHLERSQAAARHLLELVNDVLDLSKLEAGKIEIRLEEISAGSLMEDLGATLQPLAARHETPLHEECDRPELMVRTDPRRVKQILLNLVSNAVKFGEGRPVTLRCKIEDETLLFEVQDEGRGIAPEDQERIFDEFAQVGAVDGGTGLGLTISRRLAEVLGGGLTVESDLGQGSTFRLRLPKDGAAQDPELTGTVAQ